jgi:endonuclease/exonuclease/phosphatase (EEP) superfamily protein YafD
VHLPAFRKPRQRDGDARIGPLYGALRLAREAVTPNGRSRSVDRILEWLDDGGAPAPTIVGGDFNTVPLTLAPRKMRPEYRDSLWRSGDYLTGTYRRIAGPLSARVDFLFHTPEFAVAEAFVHPRSAGDHLPVFAEYALGSPADE